MLSDPSFRGHDGLLTAPFHIQQALATTLQAMMRNRLAEQQACSPCRQKG